MHHRCRECAQHLASLYFSVHFFCCWVRSLCRECMQHSNLVRRSLLCCHYYCCCCCCKCFCCCCDPVAVHSAACPPTPTSLCAWLCGNKYDHDRCLYLYDHCLLVRQIQTAFWSHRFKKCLRHTLMKFHAKNTPTDLKNVRATRFRTHLPRTQCIELLRAAAESWLLF
jgi:hypothetical protein